jgi:hypothetical protein
MIIFCHLTVTRRQRDQKWASHADCFPSEVRMGSSGHEETRDASDETKTSIGSVTAATIGVSPARGWRQPLDERFADIGAIKQPILVVNGSGDMISTINSLNLARNISNARPSFIGASGTDRSSNTRSCSCHTQRRFWTRDIQERSVTSDKQLCKTAARLITSLKIAAFRS